jgi:hypothetical protein
MPEVVKKITTTVKDTQQVNQAEKKTWLHV